MSYNWKHELWRIIGSVILALLLGLLLGHAALALLIVTAAWLAGYFVKLVQFDRWLNHDKKYTPPSAGGLWGELYTGIYQLQQRARKRNKRLVKAISRFRETTAALPDGVVVLRENGEIDWWNNEAGRLLHLKYPQDVGQRLTNLLRHPDVTAYYRGETRDDRVIITSPYDETIRLSLRVIEYGNNQRLAMVRDVTLFQQVEQMRRDFVANISHELRTPLTVLSGYIEGMQSGGMDDEQVQRTLQTMQQQTRRMQQLTDDLMLLSSFETGSSSRKKTITVDVPHMLLSLKEQAELLSGEKHHVILLEADQDLLLQGDPKELDSVFTNLVVNAINYTPTGGAIRIRWYADDSGAHFEVHDTGIGIAAHHIPRLTERFYRVDVARSRNSGGSGLGLAIVKHAMQRNQGNLRIDSEVGRGSTFICDFPAGMIMLRNNKPQQSSG